MLLLETRCQGTRIGARRGVDQHGPGGLARGLQLFGRVHRAGAIAIAEQRTELDQQSVITGQEEQNGAAAAGARVLPCWALPGRRAGWLCPVLAIVQVSGFIAVNV